MIRATAHLALFAYLVGGWILPATHHHGVSSGSVYCAHAPGEHGHTAGEHGHTAGEHGHTDGSPSCDHDHGPRAARPVAIASGKRYETRHDDHLCDGLCALCSARTLNSARWATSVLITAPNDASDWAAELGPQWSGRGCCGIRFSRGPPVLV